MKTVRTVVFTTEELQDLARCQPFIALGITDNTHHTEATRRWTGICNRRQPQTYESLTRAVGYASRALTVADEQQNPDYWLDQCAPANRNSQQVLDMTYALTSARERMAVDLRAAIALLDTAVDLTDPLPDDKYDDDL